MSTFLMNQLAKQPSDQERSLTKRQSERPSLHCQPCFLLDHVDEGEAKRWSECHFIYFLAIYIFHN